MLKPVCGRGTHGDGRYVPVNYIYGKLPTTLNVRLLKSNNMRPCPGYRITMESGNVITQASRHVLKLPHQPETNKDD
jgi:hypothetical protein